jgi:hypothetical protein
MLTLKKRPARQEEPQTKAQLTPPTPEKQAEAGSSHEDEIRPLAYQKWQEAGCPTGDGVAFWLAAEAEILHGKHA